MIFKKYVAPLSLEDLECYLIKLRYNIFVISDAIFHHSFNLMAFGLVWWVGNGNSLRIGYGPWPGFLEERILPPPLIYFMRDNNIMRMTHSDVPARTTLWRQG